VAVESSTTLGATTAAGPPVATPGVRSDGSTGGTNAMRDEAKRNSYCADTRRRAHEEKRGGVSRCQPITAEKTPGSVREGVPVNDSRRTMG